MTAPLIAASRSRAIVSVSGSSGTAGELAPTDVVPELLAAEGYTLRRVAALARGGGDVVRNCSNSEHAAAGGDERSVIQPFRAGVKDEYVVSRWRQVND